LTNLRWLKWAVAKHFHEKVFKVNMKSLKVGNAAIDGEVVGKGWKIAIELKSTHDDVVRGLGQLAEAVAYGYNEAALVTSLRRATQIKSATFDKHKFILLGVNSAGRVFQVYPTYASTLEDEKQGSSFTKQIRKKTI